MLVGSRVESVRDSNARAGDAETGSGFAHGAASSKLFGAITGDAPTPAVTRLAPSVIRVGSGRFIECNASLVRTKLSALTHRVGNEKSCGMGRGMPVRVKAPARSRWCAGGRRVGQQTERFLPENLPSVMCLTNPSPTALFQG